MTKINLSRRQTIAALAAIGMGAALPARIAHATTGGARNFIFINLRGAADGLSMVMPTGDPDLRRHRAQLVDSAGEGGTRLDAMFTLHPALSAIGQSYVGGTAVVAHAVASSYRDRSHFDAQNILETGGIAAYSEQSGWMNRLLGLVGHDERQALAFAATVPPVLRGPQPVASYAPSEFPAAQEDLLTRVSTMYAGDPELHALYETALATRAMAGDAAEGRMRSGGAVGTTVARLMTPGSSQSIGESGGDRSQVGEAAHIVSIDLDGWDTHNGQPGRIAARLRELDALVAAVQVGLGSAWSRTIVLIATEFGRTVAANGTTGTDHGTASAAILLGGAVRGGRLLADWPGLSPSALYEGRDLKPTLAMEALISGVMADHYGVDPVRAAAALYPAHMGLRPVTGLIV